MLMEVSGACKTPEREACKHNIFVVGSLASWGQSSAVLEFLKGLLWLCMVITISAPAIWVQQEVALVVEPWKMQAYMSAAGQKYQQSSCSENFTSTLVVQAPATATLVYTSVAPPASSYNADAALAAAANALEENQAEPVRLLTCQIDDSMATIDSCIFLKKLSAWLFQLDISD